VGFCLPLAACKVKQEFLMTVHISARVAWHDSGWNGRVCQNPKANTYCVGQYSFPGDTIARKRKLDWEQAEAGRPCHQLDGVLPCAYSINAFGPETITAESAPPDWFRDGTQIRQWQLPPYSVGVWPYEEMYREEMLNQGDGTKYNAVNRRAAANEYFAKIDEGKSLVFYYANYSNPFSENETNRYVITGVSRVKKVGGELTWINQSPTMEQRYGPNIWVRSITADYPDQGLRLPYHNYLDRPDVLEKILFVPENPRHFKFATRHISDDGALGLIERLLEIVGNLCEINDQQENWHMREQWLSSLLVELWHGRGLYPGLLACLDYLKFSQAIPYAIQQLETRDEHDVQDELFAFLRADRESIVGLSLADKEIKDVRKRWRRLYPAQQTLLAEVLPRLDLQSRQISKILEMPESASIYSSHETIADNPYILCEEYVGSDPDDQITFRQIDQGIIPSPDLGGEVIFNPDDWQRLRALCVNQLRSSPQHTFLRVDQVLFHINTRLSYLPDWKRAHFTSRDLDIDREELAHSLTFRIVANEPYLYLRSVFEDEREIESTLRDLANRPNITLRFPVQESHWRSYLYSANSELAKSFPTDYESAINQQVAVCQSIFQRPLSVLCGPAGTGKTTLVKAFIQAIEKAHGTGTSFQLLAPTGKAADRLREKTGKDARTLHSFLAQRGWLHDNLTFKRHGGQREESVATYILDESSMLDLPLLATFFRAVNWNSVQRLIFVGDPNQLPPIGTGKVFADLIDWLRMDMPEHVGELETNMRQLVNRLSDEGTGILDMASLYIRRDLETVKSGEREIHEENMIARAQESGDIDKDLRVLYWQDTDELQKLLIETIVADMEKVSGRKLDPNRADKLWNEVLSPNLVPNPEALQVISPYRGELFGIEHINGVLQQHKNKWWLENKGALGGVTYFDKVIQVVNRPKSNPLWAWNDETRRNERIEVYNGEIGMSTIHAFDAKKWKWQGFYIRQIQVSFSRKRNYRVEYKSETSVSDNLELAYAISVHKSQGSEFDYVYFVLPKHKRGLLSRELFYTGITRAQKHCTILVQEDIGPLLSLMRRERSTLNHINSSLFQFRPVAPEFENMDSWYEEGRIHRTLADYMVQSKSEALIANMLFERDIPFQYDVRLSAPDGTFYRPDFVIQWRGETWYWEHFGMMHDEKYRNKRETKLAWYQKHGFADHLIQTYETVGFDSRGVRNIIQEKFGV
jgi:exodeoxyribonuclease V alpha subunit